MSQTWRLFVAIELPPETLNAIKKLRAHLEQEMPQRSVRWVNPEGIHLTLKFLGDVPLEQIASIKSGLEKAAANQTSFRLQAEGMGCFPDTQRPRVLWLGVTGDVSPLLALQQRVEEQIAPLGYPSEERGFTPHLTLARTQRDASRPGIAAIGEAAREWQGVRVSGWEVQGISLMRSELTPGGAVYSQVHYAGFAVPDA